MNNGSKLKIGEPSSDSSLFRYIHLYANNFGRGVNPPLFISYGLISRTNVSVNQDYAQK